MSADQNDPEHDTAIGESSIDGVPAFSVPLPATQYIGALIFRVGIADEPLFARGVTHLVEHLALTDPSLTTTDPDLQWNGHVEAHTTTFLATGDPTRVGEFLTGVARRLHDLPFDRLVAERRVLRAEAVRRGVSVAGQHLGMRFGCVGIGTVDEEEWALRWVQADDVRQWASVNFTAGNAALWFTGPPPDGLVIDLPEGERRTVPAAVPMPGDYPAWSTGASGRVSVSFLGGRDAEFTASLGVVAEVVRERLRDKDARTYHIDVVYERLDGETALGAIVADCLDEDALLVRDAISAELSRLRLDGPDEALLERLRGPARSDDESVSPSDRAAAEVPMAAEASLTGRPFLSADELDRQMREVSAADIRSQLAEMMPTALWTVPSGLQLSDQRVRLFAQWSPSEITGRAHRRGADCAPEVADQELVVGDAGVMLRVDEDRRVTMRYDELAVAVRFEDRIWFLAARDGFRLWVRARDWHRGDKVVDQLRVSVPSAVRVDVAEAADPDSPDEVPRTAASPARVDRAASSASPSNQSPVPVRAMAVAAIWIVVVGILVGIYAASGRVVGSLVVGLVSLGAGATRYAWNATS